MPSASKRPNLGERTWSELAAAPSPPVLVVPIGACEQHGPHLPLDTDTRIAVALAERLATGYEPDTIMITPAIGVSASGEHAGFAGTLSLGAEVVEAMLVELVRSADWCAGVVFVNGHGGNLVAVRRAVATLAAEGRRVVSWWPQTEGDAHAGHTETSLMLCIAPQLVRLDLAVAGRTEPIADLIDELRVDGVGAVSPTGILGDPTAASAERGIAVLHSLVADLTETVTRAIEAWRTG
jgi:mycofactocin precursor peptide peptidase